MSGEVIPFRPFKLPNVLETQFFASTSTLNADFAREDLARSGLTLEDAYVTPHPMTKLKEGALAGYVIPYFDLNGQPLVNTNNELIFFRTRLRYPEFSRESRYTQPGREQCERHGLPPYLPYFHPLSFREREGDGQCDFAVCCEGEKKTLSVLKYLGLPAFGIGGAQMWRDPSGSGGVHKWIRDYLAARGVKRVVIVPDGDVYRYDICSAYGTYASALQAEGYTVEILRPEGKIDDLILGWGSDAKARFADLESIDPVELVQSPSSLIQRYNLAFKQNDKGVKTLYQHSSNVTRLMTEHPAFPRIWRNKDTNRVMVGDVEARPEHTEMQIANYFQHNLSMDKVNRELVLKTMGYLAKENERSPFLERIKGLEWDGIKRLDSWMIRHWGVEDTVFSREVCVKWLVGACARMDKPGTKIDWMLIVIGPQGTGKTSMPGILFGGCYAPIYGEHNDKDFHLLLHSNLCTGIDELDSFGKKETSTLKALITRAEDAFRPPYGASVEVFPRRFTLYGCGNRREFLQHDPSGYRRYAVLEVERLLDFKGLEAEVEQLWAEAWELYQHGKIKFWEVEGASKNAEAFVIASPMQEEIEKWLNSQLDSKIGGVSPLVVDGEVWFQMSAILSHLEMGKVGPNSSVMRDIAGILHALGVQKVAEGKNTRHPTTGAQGKWLKWKASS